MKRSQHPELAKRINRAFTLLNKEVPRSQITERLMTMFGVSKIQAYRYVQRAEANKQHIAIPETSVVFTVKLPLSLIKRVKKFARSRGMSISKVVRAALEDFLAKKDHAQTKEAS
jgi:predicted DNA binding CopG/RHH family protein